MLIEVCIYKSYYVSHTFALMFRMGREFSSEVVTEYITAYDVYYCWL